MQRYARTDFAVYTSISALIFVVCMRRREETKVINNPMLYNFNWTQDLFSLLIDQMPSSISEEELKSCLEDFERVKKSHGHVKDIIFVQDHYKSAELHEKIKKMEKIPLPRKEDDQRKH